MRDIKQKIEDFFPAVSLKESGCQSRLLAAGRIDWSWTVVEKRVAEMCRESPEQKSVLMKDLKMTGPFLPHISAEDSLTDHQTNESAVKREQPTVIHLKMFIVHIAKSNYQKFFYPEKCYFSDV